VQAQVMSAAELSVKSNGWMGWKREMCRVGTVSGSQCQSRPGAMRGTIQSICRSEHRRSPPISRAGYAFKPPAFPTKNFKPAARDSAEELRSDAGITSEREVARR